MYCAIHNMCMYIILHAYFICIDKLKCALVKNMRVIPKLKKSMFLKKIENP